VYDRALIVLKGERASTNHPMADYADELEGLKVLSFEEFQGTLNVKARRHANWTSSYRGVRKYEHTQKEGSATDMHMRCRVIHRVETLISRVTLRRATSSTTLKPSVLELRRIA